MTPRSDALICAILDLANDDWHLSVSGRVGPSMSLGKGAGDVLVDQVPGAFMARRAYVQYAARGRKVQVRSGKVTKSDGGAYVLLAGRLRDRSALARNLSRSSDCSDTELYAAALDRWGPGCDDRLDGDYCAIAWYPGERSLHLASSALSMHPLHVWREGSRLIAASNPRFIFATGISPQIDDAKIADSVLVNYEDPTRGWYRGIARLAPGTWQRHDPAGNTFRRFWTVADAPAVRLKRDEDYVEAVTEELRSSVGFALEGAQQPSLAMSGGLDSTALATFALEHMRSDQKLLTYTWKPVDGHRQTKNLNSKFDDETAHVEALAAMYPRLDPQFVQQPEDEYGSWLDKLFLLSAWPNQAYLSWPNELYEKSYGDGCDVSLNGYFGNVTFSYGGQAAPATWLRQGQWWRLQRELRALVWPRGVVKRFWRYALRPNLPLGWQIALGRKRGYHVEPFDSWVPLKEGSPVAEEALERARGLGLDYHFMPVADKRTDIAGYIRFHEADTGEVNQGILLTHGIEVRQPYGNRRFADLCAGLPDDLFLRDGVARWLPRQVLEGRVPDLIRMEKRTGNDSADWPLHFARYREGMLAELDRLERSGRFEEIFDFAKLKRWLTDWNGTYSDEWHSEERIAAALGRTIKLSRFVNHVEGRNVR